jgi:alpha-glucosidase
MRPVFYDYPDALKSDCDKALSFTLGRDLLIAGPPRPESPQPYSVCLPAGGWYDYWTGLPVSGSKLKLIPKLDSLPVFVRAGAILPRQPLVQSTMQVPKGPLSIDIYPGPDCRGELYFDDGITIGGPSLRQSVSCRVTPDGLALRFGPRVGDWQPWWKSIAVTVHGARPTRVVIPDQPRLGESIIAPAPR